MSRIRRILSNRYARVAAGATVLAAALIASDTAVALAIPHHSGALSDRRLKRAIRAI